MKIAGTSGIVTGGASGLGAATALRLAAAGAHIIALDRNTETGRALDAANTSITFIEADVTDEAEVQAAVDAAVAHGPLRIAVNCAGIAIPAQRTVGKDGSPHDLASFRRVVEVNLIGTFNVLRLAAAAMPFAADGERGVIVNTASLAAEDGQTGQVGYAASKAAIAGMTLPLARDLAVLGIRVNTILPGTFDTPIFGPTTPAVEDFQRRLLADALYPQRMGDPDEFAALVEHLITNSYLNAETIRLDAGARLRAKP